MIEDIPTKLKQIIEYCDEGDYMTALSFFDAEVRPFLESTDTHPQQELLDWSKEQMRLIDEEQWQQVIQNIDEMGEQLDA